MVKVGKSKKQDTYQICVTVIEARHLEPDTNPMVVVRVGNRKKKTSVLKNTDSPYYNEYFVFDLTSTMESLLSTEIEISVHLVRTFGRSKFHGNVIFEVATVWDQPDHRYFHKWAMLYDPKDLGSGPKGYVKCNVEIHVKGQRFKVPPETDDDDDIEGNLLLPLGNTRHFASRRHAQYAFTVHRAEDLNVSGSRRYEVRISFAGMKGSTKATGRAGNPRFDERLVFKDMFPPLSHRARIVLRRSKEILGSYLLNLKDISHSGDYSFLPTFGPSFVHLYANGESTVTEPIYRGRLLLSLKTEIDRVEPSAGGVHVEKVPSIVEESHWKTEEYSLVGVLYDVSMIDRGLLSRGKSVRFELSLGNAGNRKFSKHQRVCLDELAEDQIPGPPMGCATVDSQSLIMDQKVTSRDNKYHCIPFGPKKPFLFVKSFWPDTECRLRNTNHLNFIAKNFEEQLEKIEALAVVEREMTFKAYNEAVRSLRRNLEDYRKSLKHLVTTCCDLSDDEADDDEHWCLNILDKHRLNVCYRETGEVLERVKNIGELVDNDLVGIAMTHAYRHLGVIKNLCEDPQHNLPDVFLWLTTKSRRLAYVRMPSSQVFYAESKRERGRDCGSRINVFLARPGQEGVKEVCKLDLFLWLGPSASIKKCWDMVPPGYEPFEKGFPRSLVYDKASKYQLRAHIFQGRFDPGMDATGLLDPLLRVIFQGYTMTTRVIKQTLDALWDQTLVFPCIEIHGDREYIKKNPPKVVLEALDRDFGNRYELYGRCVALPLVKLASEPYEPPDFPAQLRWHKLESWHKSASELGGACLAAVELLECGDDEIPLPELEESPDDVEHRQVPVGIRPLMARYRMEAIFWGVRDFRRVNLLTVNRPKIIIECAGARLESQIMESAKKFSNFKENHMTVDLEMAEDEIYSPPITLKAYDWRGFGYFRWVGVCIIPTIHVFKRRLVTKTDYEKAIYHTGHAIDDGQPLNHVTVPIEVDAKLPLLNIPSSMKTQNSQNKTIGNQFLNRLLFWRNSAVISSSEDLVPVNLDIDRDEYHDWWSKYFASLEEERNKDRKFVRNSNSKRIATLKVYPSELESQPEFSGFQDRLRTFELRRGKQLGDPKNYDEKSYAGKFKGFVAIYRWPHPDGIACVNLSGRSMSFGLLSEYPSQEPLKLLVRLYVVKGINLRPSDPLTGKADPYLLIQNGKTKINDIKNYVPNQLNPTFGRVFEMEATFPADHSITIQVWDYDATTTDDLIGETRVDIESRYVSHHRGQCGLPYSYDVDGYNAWRDREKPTAILRSLCRRFNLPMPEYRENYVGIGAKKFPYTAKPDDDEDDDDETREERMALGVLHRWHDFPICGCALVPEHIERRPLFNPKRPGLEQGRLEMWIDMFPIDEMPVKPAVNITPLEPKDYELRVTVWNTEDVPLVDNQFLTGEKCSDIYVKGWLLPDDIQKTDVHYNSLTGEGNFNWRFVFRFTWAKGERMIIVKRKVSVFARDETEHRTPGKLYVQVYDSDHFSQDDFLGALSLDLANMPRGSHNAQNCTLRLLDPASPRLSLFRAQRIRGWWPLTTSNAFGKYLKAGKIEMELSLLPTDEADESPVGKGREEPDPLPKPNRPDMSFSWFRNPWKACCFVVFKYYRWHVCCGCFLVLVLLLIAVGIYAFPQYSVKRFLGA